jgi:mxaJ protein
MESDQQPRARGRRALAAAAAVAMLMQVPLAAAHGTEGGANALRVCADPNNLPFSNRDGAGFENKLAGLIAEKLGKSLHYTWWAQRRGFIRNTLKAGACDLVMGVPARLDMVKATRPYYRSSYVFVTRADRHFDISSIKDKRLKHLSIGVQLIGDDGFNTPPAHALSQQGIVDNLVGFTVYGDYRQPNPPARIIDAVVDGRIDVAAAWGPLAGYFARRAPVPLTVMPMVDTEEFRPLVFEYDIAVGVRKGDHALQAEIDDVLARNAEEIRRILEDYGVPFVNGRAARGIGDD